MAEIFVCKQGEMADGDVRIVASGHHEAGVFRYDGEYHAYRNLCPHQGGPVCEGILLPKVLAVVDEERKFYGHRYDQAEPHFVCPWHGYEYKLKTGECAGDPSIRLQRHAVVERDGCVYVKI
jgi:nitrite reductase/ring-hydroxylating ferredoxin subunit